jgi:hypothetical protein
MSESKESTKGGEATCKGNSCMDMHKYCFSNCCALRCIVGIIVVVLIYSIGYCAGMHEAYEHQGRHHGYKMMHAQYMNNQGEDWGDDFDTMDSPTYGTVDRRMMIYPSVAPYVPVSKAEETTPATSAVVPE